MAAKLKDGLFLGDCEVAQDLEFVLANKITRMINCAGRELANNWERSGVKYLTFNWPESGNCIIFDESNTVLDEIYAFIEEAIEAGDSCLIFSVNGINRAAFCAAVYYMLKFRWSLVKTLSFLRTKRPDLEPKPGFKRQLQALDQSLQRVTQSNGDQNRTNTWDANGPFLNEEESLLVNTYLNSQPVSDDVVAAAQSSARAYRESAGSQLLASSKDLGASVITNKKPRSIQWIDDPRRVGTTHQDIPTALNSRKPTPERPPSASYSSLTLGPGWTDNTGNALEVKVPVSLVMPKVASSVGFSDPATSATSSGAGAQPMNNQMVTVYVAPSVSGQPSMSAIAVSSSAVEQTRNVVQSLREGVPPSKSITSAPTPQMSILKGSKNWTMQKLASLQSSAAVSLPSASSTASESKSSDSRVNRSALAAPSLASTLGSNKLGITLPSTKNRPSSATSCGVGMLSNTLSASITQNPLPLVSQPSANHLSHPPVGSQLGSTGSRGVDSLRHIVSVDPAMGKASQSTPAVPQPRSQGATSISQGSRPGSASVPPTFAAPGASLSTGPSMPTAASSGSSINRNGPIRVSANILNVPVQAGSASSGTSAPGFTGMFTSSLVSTSSVPKSTPTNPNSNEEDLSLSRNARFSSSALSLAALKNMRAQTQHALSIKAASRVRGYSPGPSRIRERNSQRTEAGAAPVSMNSTGMSSSLGIHVAPQQNNSVFNTYSANQLLARTNSGANLQFPYERHAQQERTPAAAAVVKPQVRGSSAGPRPSSLGSNTPTLNSTLNNTFNNAHNTGFSPAFDNSSGAAGLQYVSTRSTQPALQQQPSRRATTPVGRPGSAQTANSNTYSYSSSSAGKGNGAGVMIGGGSGVSMLGNSRVPASQTSTHVRASTPTRISNGSGGYSSSVTSGAYNSSYHTGSSTGYSTHLLNNTSSRPQTAPSPQRFASTGPGVSLPSNMGSVRNSTLMGVNSNGTRQNSTNSSLQSMNPYPTGSRPAQNLSMSMTNSNVSANTFAQHNNFGGSFGTFQNPPRASSASKSRQQVDPWLQGQKLPYLDS